MKNTNSTGEVDRLVDHLFRQKYAQLLSILIRIFGIENLELVEDVVQESLVKALQQWPFSGIPQNPGGWILQVAKNHALDILRRETILRDRKEEITEQLERRVQGIEPGAAEFEDDQLTLMFMCSHPAFSQEAQAALILKNLCGFSAAEIARAFLTQESTIAQRLVRAKAKIKDSKIRFEIPPAREMHARLDTVLQVLYLLFNEGYSALGGENLTREELCREAIRLSTMLANHPAGNHPKVHALVALLLFQASRLTARQSSDGNLLLLSEQDRSLWNQQYIQNGFYYLEKAASGNQLSEYHLQAGIASCHAAAATYETTDWNKILSFYDMLLSITPSAVVLLNRAVAVSMVEGAEKALQELHQIENLPEMKSYYLLPATFAEFYDRKGDTQKAAEYYRRALDLVGTEPERRFLLRKLQEATVAGTTKF